MEFVPLKWKNVIWCYRFLIRALPCAKDIYVAIIFFNKHWNEFCCYMKLCCHCSSFFFSRKNELIHNLYYCSASCWICLVLKNRGENTMLFHSATPIFLHSIPWTWASAAADIKTSLFISWDATHKGLSILYTWTLVRISHNFSSSSTSSINFFICAS